MRRNEKKKKSSSNTDCICNERYCLHFQGPNFLIIMSVLKALPSRARIQEAQKLSHQIFDQLWNPTAKRNPAKILRAPLQGPELVKYYGDNDAVPTFNDFKKWFPELQLVDPREAHRTFIVEDRKRRNKGAPKKKKQ